MQVIHVSAECYPVAKVGGLGDVVGALPKYQCLKGINASVVMPFYDRKYTRENEFDIVFEATSLPGGYQFTFQVLKERTNQLGFELYLIKIPGLLDRPEVYGYTDEIEQFISFQLAFLHWVAASGQKPDIIHCHDHQAGLIPFLMNYSRRYSRLANIPTICTIHNGQYQGWLGWDKFNYLPDIDLWKTGMLDWNGSINSLAAAVKCCWKFTTVSPNYLNELTEHANGLEILFKMEKEKGVGIINGIDMDIWNPETDKMIVKNYDIETVKAGKASNKAWLCEQFDLQPNKPLIVFIGRLVHEKGADFLAETIAKSLISLKGKINFLVLGSGEKRVEDQLQQLLPEFKGQFNCYIGYNEELSHRIYAGADFLLMPSRVEPCGLNQLYSLRYGTVPIVRTTGGLKDTVIDLEEEGGYGIRFQDADAESTTAAIGRATELYKNTAKLQLLRKRIMSLNYSWDESANQYIRIYNEIKP